MIDRRDFLKKTAVAGVAMGISNPLLSSAMNKINSNGNIVKPGHTGFTWNNTIFCQFEDQELKEKIESCAKEIDCKVYYGEPISQDIIAIPYFISVLDKDLIGEKYWKEYVNFCEEVEDNTPYIVINTTLDSHLITDWNWERRARKTVFLSYDYKTPEWMTQPTAIEEIKCRTYRHNGIIKFIKKRKRMVERLKEFL
jgi:hypothetical protein|tara:strand:- start:172 stop:762 length:591 start_codon:yes stop_codon:yes gene_type:complete